jgi:hypothetical protein
MVQIALWGKRQQVEGGRLRLLALRQLGRFLIRNGRGRGRPAKMSDAHNLPTLVGLGISDRHISADAKSVARISQADFGAYLAQEDEPTLKGLLRYCDELSGHRFLLTVKNDDMCTSRALARRIVDHFPISGVCLDPCRGDGAFYDALPKPRAWCEIKDGRDFLQWNQPVDWIITNPPWSAESYRAIARHAYEIADNVVFLARWHNATSTYPRHRDWLAAGHSWRETIYVDWKDAEFRDKHGTEKREGYILAAFWWSRGWTGGMRETYWADDIGIEGIREAAE